jgi:uncharacterized protein (DUF952 family)
VEKRSVIIYHIVGQDEWAAAESGAAGYKPASLDTEAFVHFSTLDQVVDTANLFYAGRHDLVLLVVDTTKLTAEVRWEPPTGPTGRADPAGTAGAGTAGTADRGRQLFPHLYGPIDAGAVVAVHPFPPGPSGRFTSVPASLSDV